LKKDVKKVSSTGVRRVPSAFDDDTLTETDSLRGVFFWPVPNFRDSCPAGSENEFVDVDSFSDAAPEVRKETSPAVVEKSVVAAEVVVRTESPAAAESPVAEVPLLTKPPPNSPRTLSALFKGETILPKMFL
jgi:hypothetical protein